MSLNNLIKKKYVNKYIGVMITRSTYRRRRRVVPRRRRKPNVYRRTVRRIPRPVSLGVSRYKYAKLSYCDVLSGSVNTSSYQAWAYQSSLFDPYVSAGGHQPMFFDQYAAMYQRYTVMGIAYSIDVTTDAATNGPLFITVMPTSVGATATTISLVRERTGTKETTVSHGYKGKLRGYISVSKVLGVTRQKLLTDDQYSALISANPARMAFMNVQAWNQSGTAAIAVYISMRLTYYCRFFDPQEPSQS